MLTQSTMPNYIPIVNSSDLYVNGMGTIANGTFTNRISAGAARDSTNVGDIILPNTINVSFAFNGVNGLDVGMVQPNLMYAVYVIGDSTGNNASAGLFSLNWVTPTMPFGYNLFRRVGWVRTNGSSQPMRLWQTGGGNSHIRSYFYDGVFPVLTNGSATSFTVVNLTNVVPIVPDFEDTDNVIEVQFAIEYNASSTSSVASFALKTNINNINVQYSTGAVANSFSSFWMPVGPNGNTQVAIDYLTTFNTDFVSLWVIGFRDYI